MSGPVKKPVSHINAKGLEQVVEKLEGNQLTQVYLENCR